VSMRIREKIQALLWWSDNSLRVEPRLVKIQAFLRKWLPSGVWIGSSQLPGALSLGHNEFRHSGSELDRIGPIMPLEVGFPS
jgi:hypothetical protein